MPDASNELKTDDPTPLSSRMGWALLSNRKPNIDLDRVSSTPFSDMLNWPLLSQSRATSVEIKTDDPTPLSSRLNWPLLRKSGSNVALSTDNPTPLSSALNWPLLSDRTTLAGGEVSSGGTTRSADPVSKFIRQIITGEVQK